MPFANLSRALRQTPLFTEAELPSIADETWDVPGVLVAVTSFAAIGGGAALSLLRIVGFIS